MAIVSPRIQRARRGKQEANINKDHTRSVVVATHNRPPTTEWVSSLPTDQMTTVTPLLIPRFKSTGSHGSFPPGPKPRYPGQYIVEVARNPLAMLVGMQREYGDIAHWRIGPQHIYLFSHPD